MTTSTSSVALSYGVWTLLGTAPLDAVLASGSYGAYVQLRESDGAPGADAQAHYVLNASAPFVAIRSGAQVWGKVVGNSPAFTATLEVTTGIEIPGSSGGGGGGGGGAMTIADGANVAQGATTDAAYAGSGPATSIGLLKWIGAKLASTLSVSWTGQSVAVSNFPSSQTVAGTVAVSNLPGTQAISASALPLPTGAATAALQSSLITLMGAAPAQDGTDATGVTAPTGGVGIRGWLSGNYAKLTAIAASLAGTLTTALAAGSNVIGYAGSLNFQTAPVVPNLSASYSSGGCVGTAGTAGSGSAIQTVQVFRNTTQPSATLSQILFGWTGSETVNLTAYIFNKAPTTTGLTDTATPTFLAADLQHLVCAPITTTLAAAAAGSTKNFFASSLSLSVQNRDTSVSQNLYVVLVADAAITGASSGDLFFSISGVLD